MSKYLITGGAGFIGSNFIKYMFDKYLNDSFVCIDFLTYASTTDSIKNYLDKPNFKFIHGDITDIDLVDKLFKEEEFDYVINFAAESHVDRSFIYEDLFYKTNVGGVKVLLDACLKYKVKRFHQVSTDEVYGVALNKSFIESDLLSPTSPYSKSKAEADMLILDYFNKYNLNVTISRSTNNYGEYQHPEKLIPKVVKRALSGEDITIYGDGNNVRDWIYVMDHCKAIDLIVHSGLSGNIYNVGAGVELTNKSVIYDILKLLNITDFNIVYTLDRPLDDIRYSLDCSKIKNELGFKIETDFTTSFKDTVLWFKENINWINKLIAKENA